MMQSFSLNNDPNQLIQQGLVALQQKRGADAKNAFSHVINMGRANASVWLAMAYACKETGDMAEMMKAAAESIRLEPRNPRAYIVQANHYFDTGDRRAASAFYLKALNVAPVGDQQPPDLKPELEHAEQQYRKITSEFEAHLDSAVTHSTKNMKPDDNSERFMASLEMLKGAKQRYTQQPRHYFFPGLADIEFYDTSDFEWIESLEAATADIQNELKTIITHSNSEDQFSPYIKEEGNRPQSDPHGLIDNNTWSIFHLWKDGEEVLENTALCPNTAAAVKNIPSAFIAGRSPNILFSLLKAGSKIPPHNGLLNTRLICHLPLIVPEGCGFRVGNTVREWREGKVWLFDDTIEHEAWNNSEEDRYILLFEVWKPELSAIERELVASLIQSIDKFDSTV